MMKGGVAVFFVLFAFALTQSFAASDSKAAPAPPKSPSPPAYSWWHPDPKLVKCIGASRLATGVCYHEICVSYWTRKVAIGEDCCKDIVAADDDCSATVFGHFNNPFFEALLKNHCSNKASSSPAPATPAPSKGGSAPAPPKA